MVVLLRPGHAWPLLLAANRDERTDRAWDPPAAYWPDRPDVTGGRDRVGDGTWMAMRGGVFATVLNRPGSLGPQAGKRSRGALPLIALDARSAKQAAAAFAELDAGAYRTFNMVLADGEGGWFVRGHGAGRPYVARLEPGLHIVTAHDPNDPASPRAQAYLPRFRAACPPDPETGDWRAWTDLLVDRSGPRGSALNVSAEDGFGTVCSSLAAVSAAGEAVWMFAGGPPNVAPFRKVTLP